METGNQPLGLNTRGDQFVAALNAGAPGLVAKVFRSHGGSRDGKSVRGFVGDARREASRQRGPKIALAGTRGKAYEWPCVSTERKP